MLIHCVQNKMDDILRRTCSKVLSWKSWLMRFFSHGTISISLVDETNNRMNACNIFYSDTCISYLYYTKITELMPATHSILIFAYPTCIMPYNRVDAGNTFYLDICISYLYHAVQQSECLQHILFWYLHILLVSCRTTEWMPATYSILILAYPTCIMPYNRVDACNIFYSDTCILYLYHVVR